MSDRVLGELITRIRRPIVVEPGKTYAEIGVRSYGKGIFHKPPVTGADLGAKKVFEIKPGDLVFNIVFAWEGAVAIAGEEEGRCGSHRFPTYRPVPGECLAEYINLFFQTRIGRDLLLLSSPGSAGRNRTLNQEMLLGCIIPCPPIEDQRRVVDLIETVDNAVGASRREQEAALMTVQILAREGIVGVKEVPLSELLVSIEAGKSPPAENRTPGPSEFGVLKVSAIRRGWFDESQVKTINNVDGFPAHAALRDGDLLISRANTRELVGLACRVGRAPHGWYLCDKSLRLNPRLELASHDYILEVLLSDFVRHQIEDAATGTSASMKNISQESIRNLRIPLMPRNRQDEWTAVLGQSRRVARLAEQQRAQLLTLRAALMSELLSQKRQIPPSYDSLVKSI